MFLPTAPKKLVTVGTDEERIPLTIVISVVSGDLLSHADGLDNSERDVTSLSKQFDVIPAIMLVWVA